MKIGFNIFDFLFYKYIRLVRIVQNPMAVESATFFVFGIFYMPLLTLFILLRYKYGFITVDLPDLFIFLFPVVPFFIVSNYFEKKLDVIIKKYDKKMNHILNPLTDICAFILFIAVMFISFHIISTNRVVK